MTLNINATVAKLKARQSAIIYESDEDEGAADYFGEIQSVLNTITTATSVKDIEKAAEWVALEKDLVYE